VGRSERKPCRKSMNVMIKYFTQGDFTKASPPCKIVDMRLTTLQRFDRAREIAGIPFIVNSAFRTVAHERKQGRTGTSSHTTGHAMDIKATDGRQRYKIVTALLEAGFTRIGIGKTFIHADDDQSKVQEVIWDY
jgi:uncharacterized protein YcbK (DUF882 family)